MLILKISGGDRWGFGKQLNPKVLSDGISGHTLLTPSTVRRHCEDVWQWVSPDTEQSSTPTLDFLASKIVRYTFLLLAI